MSKTDKRADQRRRIADGLRAYAASQSEMGRRFARHVGMHVTDSAAIVEILRAEERGDPLTPARLAQRIGLTSGATSILLNRLEEAGHVVRRRGHADRRIATLHSTDAINDTAAEFFAPVLARTQAAMADYSSSELDLVERFLGAMTAVIDERPDTDGVTRGPRSDERSTSR